MYLHLLFKLLQRQSLLMELCKINTTLKLVQLLVQLVMLF